MPPKDFAAKQGVAVVSGGSGGLGSAICLALAEHGSHVVFTYRSNAEAAAQTEHAIAATGRHGWKAQVSLDDADAAKGFVDGVVAEHGAIHTLVYASGPHVPQVHLSRISPEQFRTQLENDPIAFFNLVQPALPHLRETSGSLVAVTTVATHRFVMKDSLSSAPKGAVEALVQAVAAEEGKFGVRANCVGAGILEHGMVPELMASGEFSDRDLEVALSRIPLKKLGSATDIAEAVCFLASDRAAYITGQHLTVDGGYSV